MPEHQHFILNKPFGYLSQFVFNQSKRKNKKLLGELHNFPEGIMAIGRLDKTSEGLLLLTTDGKVSEQIRSKKVEKEYYIQVDGLATETELISLRKGVNIQLEGKPYTTLPSKVELLETEPIFENTFPKKRDKSHGPTSWLSVTITEGKFRQVRKMSAAVGLPTLRLVRIRIGNIHLNKMLPGEIIAIKNLNQAVENV